MRESKLPCFSYSLRSLLSLILRDKRANRKQFIVGTGLNLNHKLSSFPCQSIQVGGGEYGSVDMTSHMAEVGNIWSPKLGPSICG